MSYDPYSRLVLILRVLLPLVALGILSTLFLFSSRIEPGGTIPFADADVAERIRNQRLTEPLYFSVTDDGDNLEFTADHMVTGETGVSEGTNVAAQLDFATGGSMNVVAQTGRLDLDGDLLTLEGEIEMESTGGYDLFSDFMTSRVSQLEVISPGEVRGFGPGGTLVAQRMEIRATPDGQNTLALFTGGVKLVYEPKRD